jgi:hypothetical protein
METGRAPLVADLKPALDPRPFLRLRMAPDLKNWIGPKREIFKFGRGPD